VKARKVKGLDPDGSLVDNAERVLRVRLDELYGFAPAALDPSQGDALHDMRIAAKRLRYALEVTAPVIGPGADRGIDEAKALQEVLGEIHDCDVMLEVVRDHAGELRAEDAAAVRAELDPDAEDVSPEVLRLAPNRARYRGLESLATYLRVRRDVLFANFVERWSELEGEGFREALEQSISERHEVAEHSV
jgi:hypothetical protein